MMRLLLIKTSSLGDLTHVFPALTDAVRALPGLRVDWLVEEDFGAIPLLHPAVINALPVAQRSWRWPGSLWRDGKRLVHSLGSQTYDWILDAQGLYKSACLTRIAKGPVVGMCYRSARESGASWFYDRRIRVPPGGHAVTRQRLLFSQALNYPMPNTAAEFGLRRPIAKGRVFDVLLALGGSWANKVWAPRHWLQLARLLRKSGYSIGIIAKGEDQGRLAAAIARENPGAAILLSLGLRELSTCLATSRLVIGADTGIVHLAAALGTLTIMLFGPTVPEATLAAPPALAIRADAMDCVPCSKRTCRISGAGIAPCMEAIAAAKVHGRALSLLAGG